MAKLQQRCRIGHRLATQVDAHKVAHRLTVIDRILKRLVRQPIPLRQEIHPQHPLDPNRRSPSATFGIIHFNQLHQPLPRNHLLHFAKKAFPPRQLLLRRKLSGSKTQLTLHPGNSTPKSPDWESSSGCYRLNQRFPRRCQPCILYHSTSTHESRSGHFPAGRSSKIK